MPPLLQGVLGLAGLAAATTVVATAALAALGTVAAGCGSGASTLGSWHQMFLISISKATARAIGAPAK